MPYKDKTSISLRRRTLWKLKVITPEGVSYDEFLNELVEVELRDSARRAAESLEKDPLVEVKDRVMDDLVEESGLAVEAES